MRNTAVLLAALSLFACRAVQQDLIPTAETEDDAQTLATMAGRCGELNECGACVAPSVSSDDPHPLRCGWCASEQRCEPRRRGKARGKSADRCREPLIDSEPIACAVSDKHYRKSAVDDFFKEQLAGYKRAGKPMRGALKSGGHVAMPLSRGSCYRVSYKPLDPAAMSHASSSSMALDVKTKEPSATAKAAALAYGEDHMFASVWDVGCPKSSGEAVVNFPFDVEVKGEYELDIYKRARTKRDLLPPPKVEATVASSDGSMSPVCRRCAGVRQSCDGSRGHCTREYVACLSHEGYMPADCQQKRR